MNGRTLRNTNFTEPRDFSVEEIYDVKPPVKTEEELEQEALELAQSLMRDLSLTKGIDSDFEIKEALCQDEVINSFINAFHVYRNTKDCTKCASIWFDTLQGFMQQFEKALSHQMRFYIENPE